MSEKRRPSGFIAICQCESIVGAIDHERTEPKECSKLLGKWLYSGYTIKPMFGGSWSIHIDCCTCEDVQ